MTKIKVIFHIDELHKWNLTLKNANNLLNAIESNKTDIIILANSEAVKLYNLNNEQTIDITVMKELSNKGVKFIACNNALNAYDIKKENLMDFIDIVPVGVLELINKQAEGYAYIKP